jgi:parallel beta-helix repeat protein
MDLPLRWTVSGISPAIFTLAVAGLLAFGASQASASHVSCGDEITADTTLDSDLVDCPNNGVVIGADGVTLDLNGHRIDGDGTEFAGCGKNELCDIGVANDGHDGVTVKGGTVTEFGLGLLVGRAKRNRLRDLSVIENAFEGIVMFRSARSRVRHSTASRNGVGNSRPGIALFESHHNRITRNKMSKNGDLALFMDGSDRNLIRHNRTRRHSEGGMIIEGDHNRIVSNRSVRDGGGILITTLSPGGKAVGNLIRRNEVRHARASGIVIAEVAKRSRISRNLVAGAGRSGIGVGSPSTKLTKNRAVRNGRLGIEAVEGVIDGGGNRASGNGDPRQCVNVTCH